MCGGPTGGMLSAGGITDPNKDRKKVKTWIRNNKIIKGGERLYDENNAEGKAKISYKKQQKSSRVINFVFLNNLAKYICLLYFKT